MIRRVEELQLSSKTFCSRWDGQAGARSDNEGSGRKEVCMQRGVPVVHNCMVTDDCGGWLLGTTPASKCFLLTDLMPATEATTTTLPADLLGIGQLPTLSAPVTSSQSPPPLARTVCTVRCRLLQPLQRAAVSRLGSKWANKLKRREATCWSARASCRQCTISPPHPTPTWTARPNPTQPGPARPGPTGPT